ncbi:hypothetical protein GCM10027566_28630 [Arachidicoccus ginsenosidivorans]
MKKCIVYIFALALQASTVLFAQDLSNLSSQKPVTLSGGIGAGTQFYTSNEPYKSRDPFIWNLNGNVTANIYSVSLPFSFVINQYSKSYSTPFSQFGLSPTYKWATLHLGYRSMELSPLIFGGQSFLGAGIELHPGKFSFTGFYGRLNKAISEDTTFDHRIEPQYSRVGYGFKFGFGKPEASINLSFFHASDKEKSIAEIMDTLNTLRPQENSVLGLGWAYTFFKKLSFNGDLALSLLNRDKTYGALDSIGHYEVPKFVRSFTPINESSVLSYSARTELSLQLTDFNASTTYQRIQPDYISLGTPYTVNDLETICLAAGGNLLKGHLNLSGAYSTQHNNLEHALSTELLAQSGNLSINANVNKHLNLNVNINGAKVLQKDGLIVLNDSLRMDQLMLNYSFSPSYVSSTDIQQHTLSASINYTDLKDNNPATAVAAAGNNINLSASYGLQFIKAFKGITAGLNYSVYGQKDYRYYSTGLHIGGNAQFLKAHNWNLQGDIGYFFNRTNGATVSNNTTFSLSSGYSLHKHSLSLYSSYTITPPVYLNPLDKVNLNRIPYAVNTRNLSGGITYGYQF